MLKDEFTNAIAKLRNADNQKPLETIIDNFDKNVDKPEDHVSSIMYYSSYIAAMICLREAFLAQAYDIVKKNNIEVGSIEALYNTRFGLQSKFHKNLQSYLYLFNLAIKKRKLDNISANTSEIVEALLSENPDIPDLSIENPSNLPFLKLLQVAGARKETYVRIKNDQPIFINSTIAKDDLLALFSVIPILRAKLEYLSLCHNDDKFKFKIHSPSQIRQLAGIIAGSSVMIGSYIALYEAKPYIENILKDIFSKIDIKDIFSKMCTQDPIILTGLIGLTVIGCISSAALLNAEVGPNKTLTSIHDIITTMYGGKGCTIDNTIKNLISKASLFTLGKAVYDIVQEEGIKDKKISALNENLEKIIIAQGSKLKDQHQLLKEYAAPIEITK